LNSQKQLWYHVLVHFKLDELYKPLINASNSPFRGLGGDNLHMKKVLLVEDDNNLSFMITDGLEEEGFEVLSFQEGSGALDALTGFTPDIVLLDINLKGNLNGFETAEKIRFRDKSLPVLFITSRNQLEDLKKGFSIGNMDYLKKPFGMGELLLRVNELLLKNGSERNTPEHTDEISIGKYCFSPSRLYLRFEEEEIPLRKTECGVLKILCLHKDQVLTKKEIIEHVWCVEDAKTKEASLDNVLLTLRSKLSKDATIAIITIPRTGYELKTK